jgi:phage terminase Nu1 subunit (DNA packaging protein)
MKQREIERIEFTIDDIVPRAQRIVTTEKLAWVLQLPYEEVRLMIDAKMILPIKNADGDVIKNRFDIIQVLRKLLKDLEREKAGVPVKTLNGRMDIAKVQKMQSQAEREMIHNEMMRGAIVRMEDVDAEVIDMILAIKSKLLGFPSHVARMILGKEDFDEVCKILTEEMEKTMIDLGSPSPDAIRARNRKLQKYTEGIEEGDESKVTVSKTKGI